MKKAFSRTEKQAVVNRCINGENITSISNNAEISSGTVSSWIKRVQ